MTTITTFIKRHPVSIYFALTFVLSWGCILLVVGGPGAIPAPQEQAMTILGAAILAMLPGPLLAGILLTGLVYGRAGLRELLSRLLKWRVDALWYVVALLATPLLAAATLFALLPASPVFLPGILASGDKAGLLLFGIVAGLAVGICEEIGWTGFAIPTLRTRYSVLGTGLIVGVVWGLWHFLVAFWGSGDSTGAFSVPIFLPWLPYNLALLPVFRVLMVWVYDRTGSLLVAILMHMSLTAGVAMILMPLTISGLPLAIWYLVLVAVLSVVVAAVALADRGHLARQPLGTRVA